MIDVTDKNPLIADDSSQTLENCANVIGWMSYYFSDSNGDEPNDSIKCGGLLIFTAVTDALRYESERVHQLRKQLRAAS